MIKKPILLAYWKKARLPLSAEIPRPPEPLVQRYIFDSIRRLTGIGRFFDRPLLVDCVSSPRQLVHPLSQHTCPWQTRSIAKKLQMVSRYIFNRLTPARAIRSSRVRATRRCGQVSVPAEGSSEITNRNLVPNCPHPRWFTSCRFELALSLQPVSTRIGAHKNTVLPLRRVGYWPLCESRGLRPRKPSRQLAHRES